MTERHESSDQLDIELAKLAPKIVRALGAEAIQQRHDELIRLKRQMLDPESHVHPYTSAFTEAELSFFQPLLPYIEYDNDKPPLLDLERDDKGDRPPL